MKKIIYVIWMESSINDYLIGDFATKEEAEKYIESKGLDIYPNIPIIIKKLVN
jgi:hypothetical protein